VTKFRIVLAIAFLFALASTAAAATLTANPSTVAPGGTVTVSWSDVANPTTVDWIGRYVPGAPNGVYDEYVYTSSCTRDAGGTARSSGSCTFAMPAALGTYEFRLFAANVEILLATSGPVQVSTTPTPAATLTANPSTVAPGGTVTVSWSNVTAPTIRDWIGGYVQGAPNGTTDAWVYTSSCARNPGSTPLPSGSCTFAMPTTPGTYEFRLFANDGSTVLATSGPVQVSAVPSPPTLTANPSAVVPGGTVTVSWSNVANPTTLDLIGRYVQGAPAGQPDDFVYTSSCTRTPGSTPLSSGSCTVAMPTMLGTYEFRLFANNGATLLATSGPVQVSLTPTPPTSGARIVTYTTSTTLTAEDVSRSIINNSGATAPITLNLPASAVGNVVSVYIIANQPVTINPNGTERIQILTNANGDAIQSETVRGTTITLVCHVRGSWEPMGQIGAWVDVN
jgi:uncharacterized protein YegP (UPF0339 family)